MSILEGVAGGTLGGREGGTESGGFSPPVRDLTLETTRRKVGINWSVWWIVDTHLVPWEWGHGGLRVSVSARRRAWQVGWWAEPQGGTREDEWRQGTSFQISHCPLEEMDKDLDFAAESNIAN